MSATSGIGLPISNTAFIYHLPGSLGSVRQLASSAGAITLARRFEPYGDVLTSTGSGASAYGYTGEWQQNSLVYLRARYYASGVGRFISRDTWEGDNRRPLTLNRWLYGVANPIGFIDPAGRSPTSPTAEEGIAIHRMIQLHFSTWMLSAGGTPLVEQVITNASKQAVITITPDGTTIRPPLIDGEDPNVGYADMMDATTLGVYEIKAIRSAKRAVVEAMWYTYWANMDVVRFMAFTGGGLRRWGLGTLYLANSQGTGVVIGPWPTNNDYVVKAEQRFPGAIVYWGVHRNRQPDSRWWLAVPVAAYGARWLWNQLKNGGPQRGPEVDRPGPIPGPAWLPECEPTDLAPSPIPGLPGV